MAYDETLATRIRNLLDGTPDITEKKMFGGLAFLVCGNMAIAASGQGGRWSASIRLAPMNWSPQPAPRWPKCAAA